MPRVKLTQAEADELLALAKVRADDTEYDYPDGGGRFEAPLVSMDRREEFWLDVSRGRINLQKYKYQNRARKTVILARLEFEGPPHRNPDDAVIPCPHIHLYREGYGIKWAFPVPVEHFNNLEDAWATLYDFMQYCNIIEPPVIHKGLFT